MEFCSIRELQNQTGHDVWDWLLVVLKELLDNALDACEEAEVAPVIKVSVSPKTGTIVIEDNGPGIPAETIRAVCDYTIRVSSREAYVSPSRGAQGNALKTILAMGYVLDRHRLSQDDLQMQRRRPGRQSSRRKEPRTRSNSWSITSPMNPASLTRPRRRRSPPARGSRSSGRRARMMATAKCSITPRGGSRRSPRITFGSILT